MWVAPAKGSGCVRLSAMIYEGRDAWYADAGGLTKIVCEQKPNMKKKNLNEDECCACDEAKYNVSMILFTFQTLFIKQL
jgi:spondin-1